MMAKLRKFKRFGPFGLLWPIISILAGCSAPTSSLTLADLESPDPAVRIQAIKWAGENKIAQAVPLLVDRLQEPDTSVRFFAIVSLKKITGTDHGFDYKANPAQRGQAVRRWREMLAEQKQNTQS